ncbi:crotonobetaine/carnitine-CoA ligase [Pseudodesulfovibrio sp. JC047]|uniref:crotonobetaine/carnitine-CoA ligase n=1 Tax=Pseudodesulfovibrio sp. JC047 TaxID=2683199 RepID=UPI0013D0ED9B|nr:crotonobetaine/carnitine-CoA ligase [Pseudodesulfovibrio sp. JC047]
MDIVGEKNIGALWDELAQVHAAKTALIFENACGDTCEFTYAELNDDINRAANLFLELNIRKGDKVAVQVHNSPEFLTSWFGLAKIGAIMIPINVHYRHEECAHILKKCAPKALIIEEQFLQIHQEIQQQQDITILHTLIARTDHDTAHPKTLNYNAMLRKQTTTLKEHVFVSCDDPAEIIFTSGTTTHPKGVVITHYNLCFAGRYTSWQVGIDSDDRYLTMMPACHIDFQCTAAMPTFAVGATFIMLEKYSARKFWRQVCLHRATLTECIPLMIRTQMLQPQKAWEKNHCLRDVLFYLTLSDQEKNAFMERFNVSLFTSYGMTETIVGILGDRPGDRRKWPSIGRTGICYDVEIQDKHGNEIPPNEIGEIAIKGIPGKTLFKEYYEEPEATAETLTSDGWLKTGDKGYTDKDGYFYFVDRKLNLIKRSGENIASTEIENLLVSHPLIMDAAVVGIPDTMCDETVKAFIIVKDGESVTEKEILQFCSERIAKFKVPSAIEIRKTFPRTCVGKVQKSILRKESVHQNSPCGD